MATNVIAFAGQNLPAVSNLSASLRSISNDIGPSGSIILKMDKTGHWVFGADATEVEDDSLWAVNPFSFIHGYIAWGDGEVLAEKMAPVSEPIPETPAPPPGAKRGWEVQVGFSLKCINGEDEGMEVRYTTTSFGGKKSVQTLGAAIAAQVDKDQASPVAIVKLRKEHYIHKSYGKIFTPIFEVVKWVGMDGSKDEAPPPPAPPAEVEAPAEEPAGRRRRRSAE